MQSSIKIYSAKSTPVGVFYSCLVSASPIYKRLIQKLPKGLPPFGIRHCYEVFGLFFRQGKNKVVGINLKGLP